MRGDWSAAVLRRPLAAALLLAAAASVLLLTACFEDGGTSEPGVTAVTPTPGGATTPEAGSIEVALGTYARQNLQMEYVGECEAAQLPDDQGKLCTSFRGDRGPMKAYIAGPAFTEFTSWIFVEQRAGQWQVVGEFPIRPQATDVTGIPWPLTVGAVVVVVSTGQCLNVRAGPGLGQAAIDCLKDGTTIKLAEGPQEVDDFEWWRIDGRDGWVASDWLRYPDAAQ
jgi:Bacterial SH3 domain